MWRSPLSSICGSAATEPTGIASAGLFTREIKSETLLWTLLGHRTTKSSTKSLPPANLERLRLRGLAHARFPAGPPRPFSGLLPGIWLHLKTLCRMVGRVLWELRWPGRRGWVCGEASGGAWERRRGLMICTNRNPPAVKAEGSLRF
jgi:hypothetical protein